MEKSEKKSKNSLLKNSLLALLAAPLFMANFEANAQKTVYKIEPSYKSIAPIIGTPNYIFQKKEKFGILNAKDEEILEAKYDVLEMIGNDKDKVCSFRDKDVFGFIDGRSRPIILKDTKREDLLGFADKNIMVFVRDTKVGFMNKNAQLILKAEYDVLKNAPVYKEGIIKMKKLDTAYYLNSQAKVVYREFDKDFDGSIYANAEAMKAANWNRNFIITKINGKAGVVSTSGGTTVLEPEFDWIQGNAFTEPLIAVSKKGLIGFYDPSFAQKVRFKLPFQYAYHAKDRYYVQKGTKFGITDTLGKVILEPLFDAVSPQKDGTTIITKGDKKGVLNQELGIIVAVGAYDDVREFSEGVAWVQKGGKWGIIDVTGKLIMPCKVEATQTPPPFLKNASVVNAGGKFGIMATKGEYTAAPQYETFGAFGKKSGLAIVVKGDKKGLIKPTGGFAVNLGVYDEIQEGVDSYFVVTVKNKKGVINSAGKVIVPTEFDEIMLIDGTTAAVVKKGSKFGVADLKI